MKATRNTNIELLRILSMLMVETLHCLAKSGALYDLTGPVNLFFWWIEALCICSVDVFVLITGYYSVNTPFRAQRIWRVLLIVWSYSFLTSLITFISSGYSLNTNAVLRMMIPVLSKKYWFVNAWLALTVLSPFLNVLIRALSEKQFRFLLGFLLLAMVVRPSFLPRTWGQDSSMGTSVFFFIVLYFTAAWIRLYGKPLHLSVIWLRVLFLVLSFAMYFSRLLILRLGASDATAMHFYGYDSFIAVAQAVILLLIALNRKPLPAQLSNWVSGIAKNSFSVYIIHFSLNPLIWTRILHVDRYIADIGTGLIAVICSVVSVYLACICIEELRLRLFQHFNIGHRIEPLLERWNGIWAGSPAIEP